MKTQELETMKTQAVETKWVLDPMHSQIGFKVKHLMFTNVRGTFKEYTGNISTDGNDFTSLSVDLSINPSSIDTNDARRDEHLRGADFFDVEKFTEIKFVSEELTKAKDDSNYILHGDLTIKGVTRPVKLDVEFGGLVKDPWGNEKAVFVIQGKINRKDFGLNWNAALETGGVLVGEEVTFDIEIQLVRQA